jgi:hypothetical protein
VLLRTPQNAEALAFDFDFYTYEFPDHSCTPFNDLFVALLLPAPTGLPDANIALDGNRGTISASSALFEACGCVGGPPCNASGREYACSLGAAPLAGTGFGRDLSSSGDHGATGWLTAAAPVARSSTVTLRFAIEDAGDGRFDSTVLIDHFRWLSAPPQIPRSSPGP